MLRFPVTTSPACCCSLYPFQGMFADHLLWALAKKGFSLLPPSVDVPTVILPQDQSSVSKTSLPPRVGDPLSSLSVGLGYRSSQSTKATTPTGKDQPVNCPPLGRRALDVGTTDASESYRVHGMPGSLTISPLEIDNRLGSRVGRQIPRGGEGLNLKIEPEAAFERTHNASVHGLIQSIRSGF